jgi:Lar family restriction alleviation protein
MSEQLKPCPFCGGSVTHYMAIPGHDGSYIQCDGCDLTTPNASGATAAVADAAAVRYWNTRADTAALHQIAARVTASPNAASRDMARIAREAL